MFKWTEEAKKAFKNIKELMISPPVLRALIPDGLFQLESDTYHEGTLYFKSREMNRLLLIIFPKDYPPQLKIFRVTQLELTRLLVNTHGFMQLLHNQYFDVLVDHKAIEYMVKSKTETLITRLNTLLLKLSEYTTDLKYLKGSEMHTSNVLSRLHNLMDTPDKNDVILLNLLQYFTPNYIEHAYSHWVENLHVHKTKDYDTAQVKRKHGRPAKQKTEQNKTQKPAANTCTTQPRQANKNSKNKIISRDLIDKVNTE